MKSYGKEAVWANGGEIEPRSHERHEEEVAWNSVGTRREFWYNRFVMAGSETTIQIGGLGKVKLAALRKQAKTLGLSTEGYAKRLIEDGLLLEQRARTTTFDELFAPVQAKFKKSGMTEAELDKLVDEARTHHHRRTSGKKR